ncbi:DUF3046 domain-containing protein [Quadrisphaera sp. DSM 44207]|uniref:DUF3046 domain-containing protein n=1 Tax=Quadrisphaera sp. DSM 44207 TaxID=1881057 RepID=UPI000888FF7D|nr:DUF3046 domain-containing protein [Quadrisphaera sp. DSM 44207]SDQ33700.1 Protein of unknown function [Quadrisphaera sp. DSM 44207]
MRASEFEQLAEQVFGRPYADSVLQDQVLGVLGDRTARQALADGVPPRDVWVALCDALDVPEERRWLDPRRRRAR